MIRRRTSEAGGGVLSFTFLDVLTCTMGSLVLLLVVLAQKATDVTLEEALKNAAKPQAPKTEPLAKSDTAEPDAAEATGEEEPAEATAASTELADGEGHAKPDQELSDVTEGLAAEELAKRMEEARQRLAEIAKLREEVDKKLADGKARISHLEEHERRLEQEIAKLRVALAHLEEAEAKQDVDQQAAEAELERLKTLVAETQKQIEELRKETTGKKSYAIVPYKGANGTTRRPIYIECTKDAVTIYPEGIKLSAADFDGPLRSGNPLNAALRAAREELNARAAAAGMTDLPDPYPLLIVRPDGAYAYGAAMSAISSWDADFGYEFVDTDWKLEYPDPDPRLDQAMRHAVAQARERQAMLAKAAPRQYGSRLMVGSGEGGGEGGGDGTGGGGGFDVVARPGGAGDRIGDHSGENWMAASGSNMSSAGGGYGSDGGTGQAGGNRYASDGGANAANAGNGGGGGAPGGTFASTAAGGANGTNANGGTGQQAAAGQQGTGQPGGAQGGPAGEAGGQAADGAQSAQGVAGGTQATGTTTPTGGQTFAGANSPQGAASAQGSTTASGGSAGGAAGANSGGQSGGASSGSGAGASGGAVSYTPAQTASAATSRGANWANEQASRRASAISRPIRVVVKPEQISVMPTNQGGSGPVGDPTTISFHQTTDRVLDQLAATVKSRMNEWGLAGHNMYWRPTLVLQVEPGAEQHAIRLNDLLQDSGIDVKFEEVASRTEQGAGHGTAR